MQCDGGQQNWVSMDIEPGRKYGSKHDTAEPKHYPFFETNVQLITTKWKYYIPYLRLDMCYPMEKMKWFMNKLFNYVYEEGW